MSTDSPEISFKFNTPLKRVVYEYVKAHVDRYENKKFAARQIKLSRSAVYAILERGPPKVAPTEDKDQLKIPFAEGGGPC